MGTDFYSVVLDHVVIARGMSLEHATIFVSALFDKYYAEPTLEVSIRRGDVEE